MALSFKIVEVKSTQETVREDGSTNLVDLSLRGLMLVVVDYVDSDAPTVVLHKERFIIPATETEAQITERINAFGRMVRDSRARASQLQIYVGSIFPIVDAENEEEE